LGVSFCRAPRISSLVFYGDEWSSDPTNDAICLLNYTSQQFERSHSMKLLATLLAIPTFVLASLSADAQPSYTTTWTFTEYSVSGVEHYSTNLDLELAGTLPLELVKSGWACVRDPVIHSYNMDIGMWFCSNGEAARLASAHCSRDMVGRDDAEIDIAYSHNDTAERVIFYVSCQTTQR
jgi:hypothetical protein